MLAAGPGWPLAPPAPGPLGGLRVLDLSRVLAGPYAAMVLADLGADVIKVERPGGGDDTRSWGPPFHGTDATYFLAVNRNRRSLALDLASGDGQLLVGVLAAHADVVVENFLPRHLRALGLDRIREASTRAVWVSVRGAGADGPDGELPGYDVMAQARSGLMQVTGQPDGPPTKVGVAIADVVTGLYAAVAALAGVLGRRDGPAARIEAPLLESALAALTNQATNHLVAGLDPGRMGNEHPNLVPYGPVPCADRMLVLGAGNDRQFADLAAAIGLEVRPGWSTNAGRVADRQALHAAMQRCLGRRPAADWSAALNAAGVPCAVVNSVAEAFADPHVAATDLVQEVDHPAGPVRLVGSPLRIDGRRPAIRSAPPAVGEHTGQLLAGLGLDGAAIRALHRRGVTG